MRLGLADLRKMRLLDAISFPEFCFIVFNKTEVVARKTIPLVHDVEIHADTFKLKTAELANWSTDLGLRELNKLVVSGAGSNRMVLSLQDRNEETPHTSFAMYLIERRGDCLFLKSNMNLSNNGPYEIDVSFKVTESVHGLNESDVEVFKRLPTIKFQYPEESK